MSSGSNAPRKPNVASTLFKASNRFLHGQGAGSKSMKRQRPGVSLDREALSAESNNNIPDAALDQQKESSVEGGPDRLSAGAKSKKRFVGVRQRPSGRWVAEIKDTTQKIRLWLGTFDSAEEGAKAYDSAARALRGANTRTNFVPAMACEGTVPASKAARLIRLRQMAAASKACEKEARNVAPPEKKGADHSKLKVESQVNDSALVRQDLQQSISSLDPLPSPAVDDHPPPLPSSPPKPSRLIGRRHTAPLASPKPEPEDDAPPFAACHDHGTVDNGGLKLEVVTSPPKLEPQESVTSESLTNAINHSLSAGSPQDSSSPPLSLSSPRVPFDCMQPNSVVEGVQSVSSFVEVAGFAATDHLESFSKERFLTKRYLPLESFPAFTVDNFVAPPVPIPFHVTAVEASRPLFRPDHSVISGLVAFSHHQISSCATNRDHVSMYPSEKDEFICRGRSWRSCIGPEQINPDNGPMSLEDEKCVITETKCCETRASTVCKEEMDYTSSEMYPLEGEKKIDRCILREKEFAELAVPELPWPDFVLLDETGMESGLLGLDLSCENSGVYTSAFDFSAEAIDRDSCTSVMLEEHLSDDSEFLLRMQYEQSSSPTQNFQECVLLTEPPELDYCMSPHESSLPGPPLSPQETHSLSISSSLLWRLDDASAWDGQSSGSTETTDVKPSGDGGECTSQDHEALWSSMDLAPLCMVA